MVMVMVMVMVIYETHSNVNVSPDNLSCVHGAHLFPDLLCVESSSVANPWPFATSKNGQKQLVFGVVTADEQARDFDCLGYIQIKQPSGRLSVCRGLIKMRISKEDLPESCQNVQALRPTSGNQARLGLDCIWPG